MRQFRYSFLSEYLLLIIPTLSVADNKKFWQRNVRGNLKPLFHYSKNIYSKQRNKGKCGCKVKTIRKIVRATTQNYAYKMQLIHVIILFSVPKIMKSCN